MLSLNMLGTVYVLALSAPSFPTLDTPYALWKFKAPNKSVTLQLIDRETHSAIWSADVGAAYTKSTWSKSGRAVAVFIDLGDGINRFLIWRGGEKLHDITGERFGN